MKYAIATAALAAVLCSCTSTSTRAVMEGPATLPLPEVQYTMIGPVRGTGKAFVISPGFSKLFKSPSAQHMAEENAVGQAIFNRDDVDMVTAVKVKATNTDFLGLFETSEVELKAQGVKLVTPEAPR